MDFLCECKSTKPWLPMKRNFNFRKGYRPFYSSTYYHTNHFLVCLITLIILFGCGNNKPTVILEAEKSLPEVIDFNFHVKPILSDNCYACHGPDLANQKADLRLDTEEGAYAALGEGGDRHAIVPGDIHDSQVFQRIISDDPEFTMPPPDFHLKLTYEEKATIAKWIEQGAEYKPHWSFIPLDEVEVPEVKDESKVKLPIDNFVLSRLENEGLSLSEEASKETLIRRASFDLTGLPPSIGEIDGFINDKSSDAYEKLVDRLLSTSAYGERMAADWMDVARYADSDGYLDDKHREFSPWRDWVIKAFNQNLSYDKFATWQLAGDLIPESNQETILATAFNRLNKRNGEAGIVYEEYRVEYAADRTHTLGKAFMGLSIECARCHDHKYDPISQKDYYGLFGFFNSTFEIGHPVYGPDQTPGPALLLSTEEEQEQLAFLKDVIKKQEQKVAAREKDNVAFENWMSEHEVTTTEISGSIKKSLVAHYPFDSFVEDGKDKVKSPNSLNRSLPASLSQPIIKEGKKGKAVFVSDYSLAKLGEKVGWYDRTDAFSVQLWIKPDTIHEEASVLYHSEDRRLGLKGYSLTLRDNKVEFILSHSWPQNAIQVTSVKQVVPKEWTRLTITYDGSSKAKGVKIFMNGENQELSAEYDNLYKGVLYEYNVHTYGFKGIGLGNREKFVPFKNGGIDEIKVFNSELTPLEVLYTIDGQKAISLIKKPEGKAYLKEYFLAYYDLDKKKIESELQKTREEENTILTGIQEIMVMGDLPEHRPTYVLNRGVYSARGEQVEPGTPESIMPLDPALPRNRHGLTNWLFDEKNPLTARVYVNRIWQMHFGVGIVKTSDDFGSQGSLPSHPQLLDWLSNRFIESGWDIKALHKLIVTSATYRQTSVMTEELIEKDPNNVLLARGPKFRLPAEMIRDNALAISGLLVDKVGGESVYPYQPPGIWEGLTSKAWAYKYLQEPGEGLYRRSLYSIWKRSAAPPAMMIFDIADRAVCNVKREPTSSPLQALVLLNDPQFVEASRVLAENIIREENNEETRLNTVFRVTTGRMPDDLEKEILNEFYKEELDNFSQDKEKALAYLNTGEKAWDRNLDPSEIAALGVVVNSIINTDEGFTKK
jgi:hypothetical protein